MSVSVTICSALLMSRIFEIRSQSCAPGDFLLLAALTAFAGFAAVLAETFGPAATFALTDFAAIFAAGFAIAFAGAAFATVFLATGFLVAAFTVAGFLLAEALTRLAGADTAAFLAAGLRGAMAVTPSVN